MSYDKLDDMFDRQESFQKKLDCDLGKFLNNKKHYLENYGIQTQEEMTKETVIQLFSEINEILNEINWKKHTLDKTTVNVGHVKEEIIDVQHFIINLCLIWNIDPEELYELFIIKNNKNHERFVSKDSLSSNS
jgi:dimeric dUTPase (all-alpha-NTP-PPase superfamily)